MKKIIINGTVVEHDKSTKAEVLIEDGLIIAIGEGLPREDAEIIDAEGLYILPGGVDLYTNLAADGKGEFSAEAFKQNTLSALAGGTTCIVEDIAVSLDKSEESNSVLEDAIKQTKDNSYTDYSFHRPVEEITKENQNDKVCNGFPSFVASMCGDEALNDKDLLKQLYYYTPYGGIGLVHCESDAPISLFEDLHTSKKRNAPFALATSRPAWTESEAVIRLSNLARAGGLTIALNTVTAKESVKILFSQVNEGLPITVFTSPHYLCLTEDKYLSNQNFDEETYKYCVHPPLRKKSDVDALWKGISEGIIHCIVSAHYGMDLSHKLTKKDNIFDVPAGIPGAQFRLSLLHTFGVLQDKITINKLVEITATHVTRIAGLRSKGRIEAGTDADIVIFDPNHKKTITKDDLFDACDYSPYEGMELQGFPKHVFLRGEKVVDNFKPIAQKPDGKLIFRKAIAMR